MKRTGHILAAGVAIAAVCSAGAVPASPSRTVEIEGLGGRAVIDLQGGRILSWKTPSGAELLFMPRRTESAGGDWSHGGISLCWPWFGKKGDRPSSIHGFARNRRFEVRRREAVAS
jgi:D-hexose-6-phosphate mutarotase